jgi:transposase
MTPPSAHVSVQRCSESKCDRVEIGRSRRRLRKIAIAADQSDPIALNRISPPHQAVRLFQKQLRGMERRSLTLTLSAHDHDLIRKWSRSRTLAARVVVRSRIVLMLAHGAGIDAITKELGVAPGTIRLWNRRFRELGPEGLLSDARGRGRKPALSETARETLRQETGIGGDAPTVRERARQLGVSASTVSRWRRRME